MTTSSSVMDWAIFIGYMVGLIAVYLSRSIVHELGHFFAALIVGIPRNKVIVRIFPKDGGLLQRVGGYVEIVDNINTWDVARYRRMFKVYRVRAIGFLAGGYLFEAVIALLLVGCTNAVSDGYAQEVLRFIARTLVMVSVIVFIVEAIASLSTSAQTDMRGIVSVCRFGAVLFTMLYLFIIMASYYFTGSQ